MWPVTNTRIDSDNFKLKRSKSNFEMKGVAMKRKENLGKLFAGFMKYYRRGEAERIIYDLDKLGLNITN